MLHRASSWLWAVRLFFDFLEKWIFAKIGKKKWDSLERLSTFQFCTDHISVSWQWIHFISFRARPYIEDVRRTISFWFCGKIKKNARTLKNYLILNGLSSLAVLYIPYLKKQSVYLINFLLRARHYIWAGRR